MKKLLFLLLLPIFCFGQVSNGTETEFEALKVTNPQTITTPPYLTTTGTDGTQGQIPSAYIEKTADKLTTPTYDGTGIKYYNADVMNTAFKRNASIFGHTGISSKTDQFELTVLDANTVRIKPVDFAFFLEEIYPSISIVNDGIRAFAQKDYALSQLITATGGNINLNPLTTDGLYVRYLGYDVDGNVVSSTVDFSKNDAIAQLGFVTVVKTGSSVAFLSVTPGARNVFSQPLLADMNDLQRSRVKVSSDVRVSLNAAASIATSAGLMYGASINWRGVSNVGNTSPIDEYSVTAQSTAAFNSIDPSFSTLTASPTVHTLWTELEGGIAINNSFWNTTTSARGTMANGTASVKRILIGVRGGIFVQEGQHASTACYANLSEAINNIFNAQFDDAIVPPSVAVEIARIAYIKGATNLLTQGYLQMTGGGTGAGSTVAPVSDATTVSKGILQLAGDLGGTATSPTTPTAVHITGNESFTGSKSTTNTSAPATNAIIITNSSTGASNDSSNAPFQIINSNVSLGGHVFNSSSGIGFYGFNTGTGLLNRWDSGTGSTGHLLSFSKSSVETGNIDHLGNIVIGGSTTLSGGGAAKWYTANGTSTYSGGLVASIGGVAKAYYYVDAGYATVSGVAGVGVKLQANGSDALTIDASGVVKITNLSGTGTRTVVADASGNLSATSTAPTSAAYTPTLTPTLSVTSLSLQSAKYSKIGDLVTVTVSLAYTATATTGTSINVSLPFNRATTSTRNFGSGTINEGGVVQAPVFVQSTTTTGVECIFKPTVLTASNLVATFQYLTTE